MVLGTYRLFGSLDDWSLCWDSDQHFGTLKVQVIGLGFQVQGLVGWGRTVRGPRFVALLWHDSCAVLHDAKKASSTISQTRFTRPPSWSAQGEHIQCFLGCSLVGYMLN